MTPIRECLVRVGGKDDLYPLVAIAREGTAESKYRGLVFNEEKATEYVWAYLYDKEIDIIVAILDNAVIGFVMVAVSHEYHDRPFCYLSKFWVAQAGRRSDAARKLLRRAITWGADAGCSHIFATATAELDKTEQQLFENLMRKSGFLDGGPVMSLEIEP